MLPPPVVLRKTAAGFAFRLDVKNHQGWICPYAYDRNRFVQLKMNKAIYPD
jgi:hypothetical protein